jgi:hypothetical protein
MVEKELDALIRRRDEKRRLTEGERLEEEMYAESVRRFHERQREENRWEWVRYFDRMAQSHAKLSENYRERAEKLCEEDRGAGKR